MELRHLRYFVAVARDRSFTRAAKRLNIAQPPLSRQIQQLEAELGVTLIERGSRPAHLTEVGRLFYEQAVQVLDRVEEMQAMVRRAQQARRDLFSIGFVPSTLYGKLPEVVRRYRAARPGVEVALLELTSLEQITALKEGRIDVGFGRIPLDDPGVVRHLLRNERLVAVLPSGHALLDQPGPLRLADLVNDTLIVYPRAPRPSYADQVLALFQAQALKPRAVLELRELQTTLGLVAAQAGVAVVPAGVQRFRRDGVEYRGLDEPGATSPIILNHRRDDATGEVPVILDLIRAVYREEDIVFGQ